MLPPVAVSPPTIRGTGAHIPLPLDGLSGAVDRVGLEHLALFRGRRRVSLASATVESGSDGSYTLVVPRRLVSPRSTYQLLIGASGGGLASGNVPIREVVTLQWRPRQPSPQLVAAIGAILRPGRLAAIRPQARGR